MKNSKGKIRVVVTENPDGTYSVLEEKVYTKLISTSLSYDDANKLADILSRNK